MNGFYARYGKRLFDLALVIPALLVLTPVLTVTAILVRIFLGTPIFFFQERPGLGGRLFRMCKFRTMTDARDADGRLLPDEHRLSPFGRLLRSTSLDEVPELWNVLVGHMSLVGPRPLMTRYLSLYSPEQSRRHDSPPGVTGLAQVNGRNAVAWEKRFELDVWYVENMSLWLDIKILWMTIAAVFRREGISAQGHATMPEFCGSAGLTATKKRVVVIGAGGHSKVVISTLQDTGIEIEAVFDDNPRVWGLEVLGVPVRGPLTMIGEMDGEVSGVIAIGNNAVRERLALQINIEWLTVIHPRAVVHPSATLGPGTVVFAGAIIQPHVVVGRHAIINTSASIDHDGLIADFVSIAPGSHLAGTVTVGQRSALGTGCSVIPEVVIGDDVSIGAGTVVVRDVPPGSTLIGQMPRYLRVSEAKETELKAA